MIRLLTKEDGPYGKNSLVRQSLGLVNYSHVYKTSTKPKHSYFPAVPGSKGGQVKVWAFFYMKWACSESVANSCRCWDLLPFLLWFWRRWNTRMKKTWPLMGLCLHQVTVCKVRNYFKKWSALQDFWMFFAPICDSQWGLCWLFLYTWVSAEKAGRSQ